MKAVLYIDYFSIIFGKHTKTNERDILLKELTSICIPFAGRLSFRYLCTVYIFTARFDMTLLDRGPLRAESDASDNNEYQCYLGNPDTSKDSMKSYRVGWTRDIATENPEPRDMEFTDQGNKWSVDLDVSNNNAFGVFGCNATRDGEWDRTEISTVRMVSNGMYRG